MRADKELAKKAGIPKKFRQYAARYGKGVEDLVACHKKHAVPKLDNWRDRMDKVGGVRPMPTYIFPGVYGRGA